MKHAAVDRWKCFANEVRSFGIRIGLPDRMGCLARAWHVRLAAIRHMHGVPFGLLLKWWRGSRTCKSRKFREDFGVKAASAAMRTICAVTTALGRGRFLQCSLFSVCEVTSLNIRWVRHACDMHITHFRLVLHCVELSLSDAHRRPDCLSVWYRPGCPNLRRTYLSPISVWVSANGQRRHRHRPKRICLPPRTI